VLKTGRLTPYAYCLPALALIVLVFAAPLVKLAILSLHLAQAGQTFGGVTSDNFRFAWEDPSFQTSIRHSALLLLAVPTMLVISIVLAAVLYDQVRGWKIYRSALFIPYVIAVPVFGTVASYLFQLDGAINSLLQKVGLGRLVIDWLGSETYALFTVGLVIVWREVGFGIVLFLARMLSLDQAPLEAAKIDGAGWWQRLRYVIVPSLRGTIEFYCVVASITMLAWVFAYVFTLTQGGPGTATDVIELYIYNTAFSVSSNTGIASAVSAMLLMVTTVLIALMFIVRARAEREEARA
jgi:raffinose/stachyose/melibiose transport system permease protein